MVKEKPNSTRLYDDEGYRKRASCVCVNEQETEVGCLCHGQYHKLYDFLLNFKLQIIDRNIQVLLVSSSRNTDKFIVPGGGMEPGEDAMQSAMREVVEEAGVKGYIDRSLGVFQVIPFFCDTRN